MMTERKNLKQQQLGYWKGMIPNDDILPHMLPVPYKATGSRYGACGIRIDGTPDFIDAVLSNLKSIIPGEGIETRLELARHKVDGSGIGKALPNAEQNAEVCYIRLHTRGREGAMVEAICAAARERNKVRESVLVDDPGLD